MLKYDAKTVRYIQFPTMSASVYDPVPTQLRNDKELEALEPALRRRFQAIMNYLRKSPETLKLLKSPLFPDIKHDVLCFLLEAKYTPAKDIKYYILRKYLNYEIDYYERQPMLTFSPKLEKKKGKWSTKVVQYYVLQDTEEWLKELARRGGTTKRQIILGIVEFWNRTDFPLTELPQARGRKIKNSIKLPLELYFLLKTKNTTLSRVIESFRHLIGG